MKILQEHTKAYKAILCMSCHQMHRFGNNDAILTHYNISGNDDAPIWEEGEIYLICYKTGDKNKIVFKPIDSVPLLKKKEFKYNPEAIFIKLYKKAFRHLFYTYGQPVEGQIYENNYVDYYKKRFGIFVEPYVP